MADKGVMTLTAFRESLTYRVGSLIKTVHVQLNQAIEERLRGEGIELTRPQAFALMKLIEEPGASSAELARMTGVSAQTMHQIVLRLERDGLVSRKPHPAQGRVLVVEITPKGLDLVERGVRVAHEAIQETVGRLSAAKQDQLVSLLERCLREAGDALPD